MDLERYRRKVSRLVILFGVCPINTSLKTEMYHNQHFEDADDLIAHIDEYIEYYNTKRIKVKLKGLTPTEYRNQALKAA